MMQTNMNSAQAKTLACDVLVVPAFEDKNPLKDYDYGKALESRLLAEQFSGKSGETVFLASGGAVKAPAVILLGLGKKPDFALKTLRNGMAAAVRNGELSRLKLKSVALDLTHVLDKLGSGKGVKLPGGAGDVKHDMAYWAGQASAEGAILGVYTYHRFFKKREDKKVFRPSKLTLLADSGDMKELKAGAAAGESISTAVNLCRDLANDPNNVMRPAHLANAAMAAARKTPGLKCTVLTKPKLKQLGMGSFLSVNAGSDEKDGGARLIVLEYHGGRKNDAPIAFVGKGVMFDTGGYSLKINNGMYGMKWDMAGAASVLSAATAIAALKLPINVVAIAAATENLVNENATRPGDVVTSMSGITVEVSNTDAEGRLVLADALTYAQKTYKPDTILDVATLTGAVVTALGDQIFGVLTPDDDVAKEVEAASKDAAEMSWRLPLPDEYDSYMDSDVADVINSASRGVAGSTLGGMFLKRFIEKGQKWAHLDIAGVASGEGRQGGVTPAKGCTGTVVRTLISFARNRAGA